jgi:hypothetical protein
LERLPRFGRKVELNRIQIDENVPLFSLSVKKRSGMTYHFVDYIILVSFEDRENIQLRAVSSDFVSKLIEKELETNSKK